MNYKQLDAWRAAMDLVIEVYDLTKLYPKEELFALTQQTKRAAISIPANIAGGIIKGIRFSFCILPAAPQSSWKPF